MAKEAFKVAAASSDGIVVNSHFGRSSKFSIYSVDEEENITFLEVRSVTPACQIGEHDDNQLKHNLELLSDCKYILVSRIGTGAFNMAEEMGIDCYEIPDEIEQSIKRMIQNIKINQLFI